MRRFQWLLLLFVLVGSGTEAQASGSRVALVIGNSAYQRVLSLSNPANDAAAIAGLLREARFDSVDLRQNLSVSDLRRAVREFFDQAANADVAVVYYAGHGIEVEGVNYLIPVDAALLRDRDVYDEAISLDRVLQAVESAKRLRLVILDACRDNPFTRSMKRTFSSRAISRGLVGIEPTKPNTLIAFAAKAGSTASDGDGAHSPFTTALLRHLTTPGVDLRKVFGRVRDEVMTATNDSQEPFVYGSLGGADVSLVPNALDGKTGADQTSELRRNYELAERIGTTEAWDTFIANHLDAYYVGLANAQRNKLTVKLRQEAAARTQQAPDAPAQTEPAEREGKFPSNKNMRPERPKAASISQAAPVTSRQSLRTQSSREEYGSFCSHRRSVCIAKAAGRDWVVGMCKSEYPRCLSSGIWHGPSGRKWSASGG
jgi:uncharacterized caspase-like protein